MDSLRGGEGNHEAALRAGAAHYDQPPPDQLDGPGAIEVLRAEGRFRFANQLRAWVDVDGDGRIVDPRAPRRPPARGTGSLNARW